MKNKITVYFFFAVCFTVSLFGSSLKTLEITFYPEYYYSGVMVQVKGEAQANLIGSSFDFSVPTQIDSSFLFKGLSDSDPDFLKLNSFVKNNETWVSIPIEQKRFAFFLFYNPFDMIKSARLFDYTLKASLNISELHITIQEPLSSSSFQITDDITTPLTDQHGFTFHEARYPDIEAFQVQKISVSYNKTNSKTSMEILSSILVDEGEDKILDESRVAREIPLRHRLPLWEPLAVLGGFSMIIGILYIKSSKNKKPILGKYCNKCGVEFQREDNFCSKCGRKRT